MKVTFITTVFNEENTIERLLESLLKQTRLPDEVIVVDGKSNDRTLEKIKKFQEKFDKRSNFIYFVEKGNRSVGRNAGVEKATGEIIVFSDAGCVLDRNFIKEIIKPFSYKGIDVVAGYYKGEAKTNFQKCLIPYVLVMPDKVNPGDFLPATRSMAIRKSIFEELGGFDVMYSHNEDYVFSKKLQKYNKNIKFTQYALVTWIPRSNMKEAFNMFYRFSMGDMEAGLVRPKVIFLFARYFFIVLLFLYLLYFPLHIFIVVFFCLILMYSIWAISKNYQYVKHWQAFLYLPLIQYTADLAVMVGSLRGLLKRYGL